MTENIDKYNYLWDGSEPGWKLLRDVDFPGELFIVNREMGSHLHVDSPRLKEMLCARMLGAGIEIEEQSLGS